MSRSAILDSSTTDVSRRHGPDVFLYYGPRRAELSALGVGALGDLIVHPRQHFNYPTDPQSYRRNGGASINIAFEREIGIREPLWVQGDNRREFLYLSRFL